MCRNIVLLFSMFLLKLCAFTTHGIETDIDKELPKAVWSTSHFSDNSESLYLITKFLAHMDNQQQRILELESSVNNLNRIVDGLRLQMDFQVRDNTKLRAEIDSFMTQKSSAQKADFTNKDISIHEASEQNSIDKLEVQSGNKSEKARKMDSRFIKIIKQPLLLQSDDRTRPAKDKSNRKIDQQDAISRDDRQINGQRVAFSAYLDHYLLHIPVDTTIKCNRVLHNEGTGYNAFNGIFTAPTSGTYFFTFTIHSQDRETNVRLVLDGQNIVGAVAQSPNLENNMASNSAIIHVNMGQSVWLETIRDEDGHLFSSSEYRQVTFTGFLLP